MQPGTELGHYTVLEAIGRGGMGEVWRAKDQKLGREVAIKTLPVEFAQDTERLARFEREAKLLASLNHPNIAAIYGLEEHQGTHFLVLELVEGPTLDERMRQGAIPIPESLRLALQIAEAFEAAHEKGVIHRDLKPSNVKITPQGQVKVLDFGLAKALATGPDAGLSNSPTLSIAATRQGVILGTAGYMSPEQAKGEEAGKTADIWAFGIVLLEMLSGREAFGAPSVAESLAKILEREVPLDSLPPETPANIRRLLARCLDKDPRRRLQHIGDARIEISSEPEPASVEGAPASAPQSNRWALATIAILLLAVVGLLVSRPGGETPPPQVRRFVLRAEPGTYLAPRAGPALSRDGTQLAFGVVDAQTAIDSQRLLVQNLEESFDQTVLVDREPVLAPVFSPDGGEIVFNDQNSLRSVSSDGGASRDLVPAGYTVGVDWISSDEVVFGVDWGLPLRRALTDGSRPVDFTRIEFEAGERGHLWPQVLPDLNTVLFVVWSAQPSWDDAALAVADVETGDHRIVLERAAYGRYVQSGHLVFWRSDDLWAVAFDIERLETLGDPVRVVEGVRFDPRWGQGHFSVSEEGTLAYVAGGEDYFEETFIIDTSGTVLVGPERFEPSVHLRFSPDGSRLAMTLQQGGTFHIGVYDLERDLLERVTSDFDNIRPTWTPDGRQLTYMSTEGGAYGFFTRAADGTGTTRAVLEGEPGNCCSGAAWSPDGTRILYSSVADAGREIRVAPTDGSGPPTLAVNQAGQQLEPAWSPDGRHFAYQSQQTGASDFQVYVRPFPDTESAQQQVSLAGGWWPVWSEDGGLLYYASNEGIRAVRFESGAEATDMSIGQPALVVEMTGVVDFDVSPDGEMFAINRAPIETFATDIHIVLNWFEELNTLVPSE